MEQKDQGQGAPMKMRCPACGAEFNSQRELNEHEQQAHQGGTRGGAR